MPHAEELRTGKDKELRERTQMKKHFILRDQNDTEGEIKML